MADLPAALFLFDGSLEGLLTALARAWEGRLPAARFSPSPGAADLFDLPVRVTAQPEQAAAFLDLVRDRAGTAAAGRIVQLWCAETEARFGPLYDYLRLGLERGASVDGYQSHPAVREVLLAARRVTSEIHRLHGLLRFRELADGVLYGPITPEANVAVAVAHHFQERLRGERWLIHDTRRGLGVGWDGQRLEPLVIAAAPDLENAAATGLYHPREEAIQELWRRFFKAVAIPERINPELQRRCLPQRYWPNLVESPAAAKNRPPPPQ